VRTVFSTDLDEYVEAMSGLSDIWTRMRVVTGRRFRCTLASRSFPSIACASGTITPAIYEVDGQRTEQTQRFSFSTRARPRPLPATASGLRPWTCSSGLRTSITVAPLLIHRLIP